MLQGIGRVWDAILVTVDGLGVTRIGCLWDAILATDDGFGALMCQKCAQSQIRLGEWGEGGGSANREPGSYTYIYIYGKPPPMNYRPSFCIVNTVSKQLFRQVRILYLSKTTENKLRFQENVSVNSLMFDVRSGSCISQGLLKSISHFNRTCQSPHCGST